MPDEVFIIVIVAILAGTFSSVVKMIIGYLQTRQGAAGDRGSLTESQLRRMIEESVDSSVAMLERRFDRVEDRLERMLPAADDRQQIVARQEERPRELS